MPSGLMNAPMSIQMLISEVLKGIPWAYALVYIDDILIYSKSFEEHLVHLDNVFERLREAKLTLKPAKCQFARRELPYLGL